jgi:hypothetical protein
VHRDGSMQPLPGVVAPAAPETVELPRPAARRVS